MNINIEHLRCFRMVAQQESFTKAAAMLYMTQPSLSRMMASLEKEWDVSLFVRTTREVHLTAEGQRCLESVNKILTEYDSLEKKLKNMRHLRSGDLNIGYNSPSEPPIWFMEALLKMTHNYPSLNITVHQSNTKEAISAVQSGELDCAMVFLHDGTVPDGLDFRRLDQTGRYAMMTTINPLSEKDEVMISDLEGKTVIVLNNSEKLTYIDLHGALDRQGVSIKREQEVRSIAEMAFQVELTNAIGITALIDSFQGKGTLVFRPIPELSHDINKNFRALIWKSGDRNPSIALFREQLEEELTNYRKNI